MVTIIMNTSSKAGDRTFQSGQVDLEPERDGLESPSSGAKMLLWAGL